MHVNPETLLKHRTPQQGRSRASFERMLDTAETLMIERGSDEFTLNEVAKVGKVSIGSIYCRFSSKDDLIHVVQSRVLARVDAEVLARIDDARARADGLRSYVAEIVEAVAESLRTFAPAMRPFMMRANSDPAIAELGKASYIRTATAVCAGLLADRGAIRHPDPDLAADAAFRMLYASLARYLGFGSSPEAAGEGDWTSLKQELAHMVHAYLRFDPMRD